MDVEHVNYRSWKMETKRNRRFGGFLLSCQWPSWAGRFEPSTTSSDSAGSFPDFVNNAGKRELLDRKGKKTARSGQYASGLLLAIPLRFASKGKENETSFEHLQPEQTTHGNDEFSKDLKDFV